MDVKGSVTVSVRLDLEIGGIGNRGLRYLEEEKECQWKFQ